ncbi:DHA2 family efflux MFS transporter permease subunit, partial [Patulibacter sp. S7RM1-6]
MNASPSPVAAPAAEPDRLDAGLVRLALVVLLGAVVAQLDATIVSVAIDTLGRDLDASVSSIQWVTTGYLLALALMLPVSGWAVQRFGAKPVWLFALAAFLGGSVLCGLAWDTASLVAFRVVQGVGGGILVPTMQTILAQAAGPRRMGRLMGTIAIPVALAPVLGPVIGGLIVSNVSWRWIFFVNVPVCLAAIVLAWRVMPRSVPRPTQRLDVLGLALLSPGLAAFVYGCSRAGSHGGFGNADVLAWVAAGLALLAAFAVHALRTRHEPLVDLRLFRSRAFTGSSTLMLLFGGSLFGAMFLLPLYFQQARDASALQAGLLLAPQGLGMMVALVLANRVAERVGARWTVLGGIALSALGTIAYATVGAETSEVLLGASLVVRGMGLGAALVPVLGAAYHGLGREDVPRATTAVRIFQQIGGSLGTAVLAVVLQHAIAADPADVAGAFGDAFAWTLVLTAAAALPALLLPGREAPEGGSAVGAA